MDCNRMVWNPKLWRYYVQSNVIVRPSLCDYIVRTNCCIWRQFSRFGRDVSPLLHQNVSFHWLYVKTLFFCGNCFCQRRHLSEQAFNSKVKLFFSPLFHGHVSPFAASELKRARRQSTWSSTRGGREHTFYRRLQIMQPVAQSETDSTQDWIIFLPPTASYSIIKDIHLACIIICIRDLVRFKI